MRYDDFLEKIRRILIDFVDNNFQYNEYENLGLSEVCYSNEKGIKENGPMDIEMKLMDKIKEEFSEEDFQDYQRKHIDDELPEDNDDIIVHCVSKPDGKDFYAPWKGYLVKYEKEENDPCLDYWIKVPKLNENNPRIDNGVPNLGQLIGSYGDSNFINKKLKNK